MNEQDLGNAAKILDVISFSKIMLLVFGLVCLGIATKFIASLGSNLHKKIPSRRLLIAQIVTTVSFSIYILGGSYLFYGIIQPPKALILAVSGTLAVALGLSLKDLIASVVAGVILLFGIVITESSNVTIRTARRPIVCTSP